jgi:hypothetical protein
VAVVAKGLVADSLRASLEGLDFTRVEVVDRVAQVAGLMVDPPDVAVADVADAECERILAMLCYASDAVLVAVTDVQDASRWYDERIVVVDDTTTLAELLGRRLDHRSRG